MSSFFRLVILLVLVLGGYTLYNTYQRGEGFTSPVLSAEAQKTVSQATSLSQTAGQVLGAMIVKSGLADVAKSAAETAQYTYCKGVVEKYDKAKQ